MKHSQQIAVYCAMFMFTFMILTRLPRLTIGLVDNLSEIQAFPALIASKFDPILLRSSSIMPVNTSLAQKAVRLWPQWSNAWKVIGRSALAQGNYTNALAAFNQLGSKDPITQLMAGHILIVMGQEDQAVRLWGNQTVNNLLVIGSRYSYVGEQEKAIPLYELAVQADPNSLQAIKALSASLVKSDPDRALELLERAAELDPSDIDLLSGIAWIYVEKEEFPESLNWCGSIKAIKPGLADGYVCVGKTYFYWGQYNLALAEFQQAKSLAPGESGIYFWLSNTDKMIGDYQQADTNIKIAINLQPDAFDYHLALAQLYDQQGMIDLAIAEYSTVLSLNPNIKVARDRLSELGR